MENKIKEESTTMINEEFKRTIYKVKKQTLTLEEFLEYKNWVCSAVIDEKELTVDRDLLGIFKQFAFAKYYLDIELPNIDTDNFLDDYALVCGIDSYNYREYINDDQFDVLEDSIHYYLDSVEEKFKNLVESANKYSADDFLKDISNSIVNFIDTMEGNFNNLNIEDLMSVIDKFQAVTENKIGIETFVEHARQVAENEEISKEDLAESIVTTAKKAN